MAEMVIALAPFGIAPDEYFELMALNNICSVMALNNICNDTLNVKITGFNADDGMQVGTLTGDLDFGKGAIKSFFKPGGPSGRRSLHIEVELSCPKGAVLKEFKSVVVPSEFPIRLEIVNKFTNATIRRIEPSFITFTAPGDVAG